MPGKRRPAGHRSFVTHRPAITSEAAHQGRATTGSDPLGKRKRIARNIANGLF
jgi:hypothetical protein